MVELSAERMASLPAPLIAEKMDKKASKPSAKENIDSDCEGKKILETTSVKNSQKEDDDVDEEDKKKPKVTTEESPENDSNETDKDSQVKENKPSASESTDKDEKEETVTSKVKDIAATDDDDEKKVEEEKSVESKLDAEALSASLSSSRCLLKRNRDDLELDSDGDNQEEPDCKKSHTAAASVKTGEKEEKSEDEGTEEKDTGTPVVVEKSMLPPAELVASLSSSKSVLKRSIDQVTESAEGSAAPEVKKSNIVSDQDQEDTETSEDVSSTVEPSDDLKTPVKPSRTISNVSAINIPSPRMLIMSPSSPPSASKCPHLVLESTRLSPVRDGESYKEEREDLNKSPKIPKEEVRVIAAKDLAEDRKLEKRRLNKLLTIFDDQKPVK